MIADETKIRYIGGATALLEIGGLKLLTDPAFDPKGSKYDTGLYVLHKLTNPLIEVNKVGKIDFVLLSYDHHFDNLDNAGRQMVSSADKVFTTVSGAERLAANSVG